MAQKTIWTVNPYANDRSDCVSRGVQDGLNCKSEREWPEWLSIENTQRCGTVGETRRETADSSLGESIFGPSLSLRDREQDVTSWIWKHLRSLCCRLWIYGVKFSRWTMNLKLMDCAHHWYCFSSTLYFAVPWCSFFFKSSHSNESLIAPMVVIRMAMSLMSVKCTGKLHTNTNCDGWKQNHGYRLILYFNVEDDISFGGERCNPPRKWD